MPPSHCSLSSGSLVHYLSLCPAPSYRSSGHSGTHDPVCGKRWGRSGNTKELAAINFSQATFTIIQRDSPLIALTLSLQRACLSRRSPFSVNTKEPSCFIFIKGARRVLVRVCVSVCVRMNLNCWIFYSPLLFSFLCSCLFSSALLSQFSAEK